MAASRGRIVVIAMLAAAGAALPGAAQQQNDLQYHTVPPCVFLDTRAPGAGGPFGPGATRSYTVVGSGSLAGQGGSPTGCGVPGFSGGLAQVQAVEVNLIAVAPGGVGYLIARAADAPSMPSVVNFAHGVTVANTATVAVAQASGMQDITFTVEGAATHIVASVVGYYTRRVQTVPVHPVPGDNAASGTALLNALAAITDNSAAKHYVIQLEPGTYDVGATMIQMKPFVDLAGAGRQATVIQGLGNNIGFVVAVIGAADTAEIRDLRVVSVGSPSQSTSIGIIITHVAATVRRVDVVSSNAVGNWGIRNLSANSIIEDVNLDAEGGSNAYGISFTGGTPSTPALRRAVLTANGAENAYGIYLDESALPSVVRDVEATATGTAYSYGFYADFHNDTPGEVIAIANSSFNASGGSATNDGTTIVNGGGQTLSLSNCQVTASGTAAYAFTTLDNLDTFNADASQLAGATGSVNAAFSNVNLGASRTTGAVTAGVPKCAASYTATYVPLSNTCT